VKALVAVLIALAFPASAFAHAEISPPLVESGKTQLFTLAVPTEKEGVTTTTIELTPPEGFAIDSFVPADGWKRKTDQSGQGEDVVFKKVTWSGGSVPTDEDATFQFLAAPSEAKTYTFTVRQTYSDGTVVDWSGAESSDTPAPTIEARTALAGGGTSTLAIVAVVLALIALVLGVIALLLRAGGRDLA
jgi:uncharacterized protein YcnI